MHKGRHIRGRINTVGDIYKEGYIEGDINKKEYTKGDIHGGRYMKMDIYRIRGDIYEGKHIYREIYRGGYIWKEYTDRDIDRYIHRLGTNRERHIWRATYTEGNT